MNTRYNDISNPLDDTMEWLFSQEKSPSFTPTGLTPWLAEGSGLFWVGGRPGSGKSTLMKTISDSERTVELLKQWAKDRKLLKPRFFFHNRGSSPLQKSKAGLFRSLLYSILDSSRELIPVVFPKLWDRLELAQLLNRPLRVSEDQMLLPELLDAIRELASQTVVAISICCFIDGLDEFQGSDAQIIDTLIGLQQLCSTDQLRYGSSFKLLFSCRDSVAFEMAFYGGPNFHLNQYTRPDIATYVRAKLKPLRDHLKNFEMNEQMMELDKISEYLVRKAAGVFLCVAMAVQSLLEGINGMESAEELWCRVESVPADLDEFYRNMWENVINLPRKRYPEAQRLFLIALEAPNVFTDVRFVYHAEHLWEVQNAKTVADLDYKLNFKEFAAKVKVLGGGFLEISADGVDDDSDHQMQVSSFNDTSRLYFAHETMKEFVRQNVEILGDYQRSSIDVYLMNAHLLLLRDISRTSNGNVEPWELQSP